MPYLFLFLFRSFFTLTEGVLNPSGVLGVTPMQVAVFREKTEAEMEYCGRGNGGDVDVFGQKPVPALYLVRFPHPQPPRRGVRVQVEY